MSLRMRFLVLALLIMMMVSSCLATNRHILMMIDGKGQEKRQLAGDEEGRFEYPGSSVNNHHNIPRQDFNNYNGGSGTPKGGNDDGDG
ncbi:hypothetical protein RHSIM_Rhsim13G0096900 [Rhododendron simsii]|uniref:Glycine-rich protein n=1 Tax=Rhododendron simsii TaxID=118357 RepID=A0A834G0H3_RHOSS|nr:hypothetical protein RHSIM_Rhsim13G0096900 [Rhododendron simsii]